MIFDEDDLSKEEKNLIDEIKNMPLPELMAFIKVGEEHVENAIDDVIHCEESKLDDSISNMTSAVLILRYCHNLLKCNISTPFGDRCIPRCGPDNTEFYDGVTIPHPSNPRRPPQHRAQH